MPVCRLIYRIDFALNFKLIDAPGTIFRLLSSPDREYWETFGEASQQRVISGTFISDKRDYFRSVSIQPQAIVLVFESIAGVDLSTLEADPDFTRMLTIAGAVADEFNIDDVKRMGLRLFYFSKVPGSRADIGGAFRNMIREDVTKAVEGAIGGITDYGIALDGKGEDGIHFHLRYGPVVPEEAHKYFDQIDKVAFEENSFNFVCDLDLYEKDFALAKAPPAKWVRRLIRKHRSAIAACERSVKIPA